MVAASLSACNGDDTLKNAAKAATVVSKALTAQDVEKFLATTEQELVQLNLEGSRAAWINSNFITQDTSALAAAADQKVNRSWGSFCHASS